MCKKIGREDLIFHAIKRKYKVDNIFIKKNNNNKIRMIYNEFWPKKVGMTIYSLSHSIITYTIIKQLKIFSLIQAIIIKIYVKK